MEVELNIDNSHGDLPDINLKKKGNRKNNRNNNHGNNNDRYKFNPFSNGDIYCGGGTTNDYIGVSARDTNVNQKQTEGSMQALYSPTSETGSKSTDKYSFWELQQYYRAKTSTFFKNTDNYDKLRKLVYHRDERIFSILLFFVIRYKDHSLYLCQRSYDSGPEVDTENKPIFSFYKPKDEYNRTLKKYKKRFYDFESKVGAGDLIWDGIRNPKFLVSPDNGPISLPLAKLIACYWFIEHGFDTVFWENYSSILQHYEAHTQKTKKKYTEAHKQKKKQMRHEIEKKVIAKRDMEKQKELEESGTVKKRRRRTTTRKSSRRKTRLSRELRREVTKQIQDRKLKMKAQAAQIARGEIIRKRRRPTTNKKTMSTTMHLNPPSISI